MSTSSPPVRVALEGELLVVIHRYSNPRRDLGRGRGELATRSLPGGEWSSARLWHGQRVTCASRSGEWRETVPRRHNSRFAPGSISLGRSKDSPDLVVRRGADGEHRDEQVPVAGGAEAEPGDGSQVRTRAGRMAECAVMTLNVQAVRTT